MNDKSSDAKRRHAELSAEIRHHDRLYYIENAPEISDREYDRLFQALKDLESTHPELSTPLSPTQRIGATPKVGFLRVRHESRMYSLDNTYNQGDVEDFLKRVEDAVRSEVDGYVIEPKLDGASIELTYRNGELELAATRGDGLEGEDVTSTIRTIRSLPLVIPEKAKVILRGEVFINRADLETVNRERIQAGEQPFANPRNAAAGSLRLLDPSIAAERPLRIFLYEVVESPEAPETHAACLDWIARQGLPAHKLQILAHGEQEIFAALDKIKSLRNKLPYEIDGAVIKVNSLEQRRALGHTARFPRFAVAFKFEAERAQTRLLAITVQVGRSGTLTPVAELEPVPLSGSIVSRASLHNEDEIRAKDIRVGDTVVVEKAGEIIPQVVEAIPADPELRKEPFAMPNRCPICNSETRREAGESRWRCTNRLSCPGQLKASILHFARRAALDIEHLGPSLIDQLVEAKLISDPADLYALTEEQLSKLDRMGEKSAKNLLQAIESSRLRTLDRLIAGLGIPLVGEVAARELAKRYSSLQDFACRDPERERLDLSEIHGIGPKIAESVASALEDPKFLQILQKLLDQQIDPHGEVSTTPEGSLIGSSFCVTGTLSRPRAEIHAQIQDAGGTVHTTVKKTTTYLVAGSKVGQNKIDKAKKNGTLILDEHGLTTLLGT